MGKTAFSGPVYGAKAVLATLGPVAAISTGAGDGLSSVVLGGFIVPTGEDWYATELNAYRCSTGSTSMIVTCNANSSAVGTVAFTSSNADQNRITIVTRDGGEYEGKRIASGSTVNFTISQSSVVGASSGLTVTLHGFRRFVDSSRTE